MGSEMCIRDSPPCRHRQVFPFQREAVSFAAWCNAVAVSEPTGGSPLPSRALGALGRLHLDLARINFEVREQVDMRVHTCGWEGSVKAVEGMSLGGDVLSCEAAE